MARKNDQSRLGSLRDAIDRNLTGDKVAFSDPAAAPLETDSEASSQSTPAAAVAAAQDHQRRIAVHRRVRPAPFAAHLQPGQSRAPSKLVVTTLALLIGLGIAGGALSVADIGDRDTMEQQAEGRAR